METLIGIQFKDFVLLASDTINTFSIIVVKDDMNKLYKLTDHLVMAVSGEAGDSAQFADYIHKNIVLYKMRNGYDLLPGAASGYVQHNLAHYLRSRTPYFVNLLLAGFDTLNGTPELYFMDYLATCAKVPYGMHGYGAYFAMGLLDRIYKPDCTLEEGLDILKKCVAEIQKRLVINLPNFKVCMINKDGIKMQPDLCCKSEPSFPAHVSTIEMRGSH